MSAPHEGTTLLGRRRALQLLGVGLTAGGLLGLEACKEGGAPSTELSGGSAPPPAAPKPPAQVAPPPAETTPAPAQAAQPPPAQAQPPPAQAQPPPAQAEPTPAQAQAAPAQAAAPPAEAGLNCKTAAPIDETAQQLRRALQYHEAGVTPEKRCRLCAQFEAGKYGACGGCKLFGGAVNPEGVCLSFAPAQLKKG